MNDTNNKIFEIDALSIPVQIYSGQEKVKVIPELLKGYTAKTVFLAYDKGVEQAGIVDKVKKWIDKDVYKLIEFDGVKVDPPFDTIQKAIEVIGDNEVDVIIAIGGGSAIDTGKTVGAILAYPERSIDELFDGLDYSDKEPKPFIAIPTTAGTGSEISRGAVLTNPKGTKYTLFTKSPHVAILDPELTASLPREITLSTALDVLTHAMSSYTGALENPISDSFSEKSIRILLKYLPIVLDDGSNLVARQQMAIASTLGGFAINTALLQIDHCIGHTIGAKYRIPHGTACGIAMPYVVEFLSEVKSDKIKSLCEIFGIDTSGKSARQMGTALKDTLIKLYEQWGVPTINSFEQADKNDIDELAKTSIIEGFVPIIPREFKYEDAKQILEEIFEAYRVARK